MTGMRSGRVMRAAARGALLFAAVALIGATEPDRAADTDPAHWIWPAVASDPALRKSIIEGGYTAEELRNIRTELSILAEVTARRATAARDAERAGGRPQAAGGVSGSTGAGAAPAAATGGGQPGARGWPPYFQPDVIFHGRSFRQLEQAFGGNGYSDASIPDRTNRVVGIIAKGDRVWVTWMIEGHHGAPIFGYPGSGKPISIRETAMLRFREGRIAEIDMLGDELGLYLQAGGALRFPGVGAKP